jgi:hypothetical protein
MVVGEAIAVITEYFAHGRMWKAFWDKERQGHPECDRHSACQRISRTLPATNSINRRDRYICPVSAVDVHCILIDLHGRTQFRTKSVTRSP